MNSTERGTFTINDLLNFIDECLTEIALRGVTNEFRTVLFGFCGTLSDILSMELGVTRGKISELPCDTKIGPRATEKFIEFKVWVEKNK